MAPLTQEDRILIKILRIEKGYNAYEMMTEFSVRKWNKYALYRLIEQIDAEISQTLVDSVIDQWERRQTVMNAVIRAHGGHIEYLFN